jgi:hypothetical protein
MIRKLVDAFLWFCVASILAQLAILTVAAARGNLNDKTMTRVLAALNGVDIQGERLRNILVSAKEAPVPTYEDVLNAKVKSSLELDSRQEALDRLQRQVSDRERMLRDEINRFELRRKDFQQELDRIKNGVQSENLNEIRKIIENLAPDQAKAQLLLMLKNNQKGDVVSIIKALPPDKQKKLLAEFTSEQDQQQLSEIISELKNTTSIDQTIEKADPGLTGN